MASYLNLIWSGVVAVLSFVFGDYWVIFALYLVLQVIDYVTGCYAAYKLKQLSSKTGIQGILKKVMQWVIIVISFIVSYGIYFVASEGFNISEMQWIYLIGYFTLATMFINELRSIIENLVESGINVPTILTKGLSVIEDKLEQIEGDSDSVNK
nr:MAG TPA: holin [Caudoviricetes sp.]